MEIAEDGQGIVSSNTVTTIRLDVEAYFYSDVATVVDYNC